MKFLRFSLFLIIFTLLSIGLLQEVFSQPIINYQNLTWGGNNCATTYDQDRITGVFPTQIANVDYRPESTTICIKNTHGFNGTDYGFFIKLFQTIDYATYVMTASPTGGNTSVFKVNGAQIGAIGYNTSFTHVDNNVYLVGLMSHTTTAFDEGTSNSTVGSWDNLGVSSCTDYTTLTGDIFHEFVYQVKNDTTASFAFELFIDGNYWCTYLATTSQNPFRTELGNTDDLGTGAGTGNLNSRYREYEATPGRHLYSQQLAGISSGFGVGSDPTGITIQAFNLENEITLSHQVGQIIRFQALLLNITDPFGVSDIRLGNFPLTISRNNVDLSTAITNTTGWAEFLVTPAGASGDTVTYVVTFTGDLGFNLAGTTTSINIILIPVGASSFQSTALSTLTARDINERSRIIFAHDEFIKFRVRLTDQLGNPIPDQAIVFHTDKNNTGTFVVSQVANTNPQGIATTTVRRIDDTFTGTTRIQARYQGDLQFQASNSTVLEITIVSAAGQFDLTIRLEPNPVNPGAIYRISGALELIQPDGLRQPLFDQNVQVFRADVNDIWQFLDNKRTNVNGLYQISTQNAEPAGSLTIVFRANASINSIGIISNNITLTINSIDILEDDLPIGGTNLDDFFPDIDDIDFGFGTNGGNGILLWLIFFMMFAFGGIFAMNRTFPEAMSSNVVIAWFVMMFGASTGVSFGLQWITLNFVILLLAPIALIGGIVLLKIFRGGGTT